jgi:hypothetical protein
LLYLLAGHGLCKLPALTPNQQRLYTPLMDTIAIIAAAVNPLGGFARWIVGWLRSLKGAVDAQKETIAAQKIYRQSPAGTSFKTVASISKRIKETMRWGRA